MPNLRGNPVANLTEYELRHLAAHLAGSGRAEDLHRLLALETDDIRNAWYDAKAAIGDMAGYIADVVQARLLAEEIGAKRDIGLQIRYALMISSIHSLAQNIPPVLLGAMVRKGLRSPSEGLTYIRQIPDHRLRAEALVEVLPGLPKDLLLQALELAQTVGPAKHRTAVIAQLAPRLPEPIRNETLGQAFREIQEVESPESRATLLTRLAPHLPAELRDSALDEARVMVQQIADREKQADLLIDLVTSLPEPERAEMTQQALAAIHTIQDVSSRTARLAQLAPHLPEGERAEMLERALEAAQAADAPFARATALASLLPLLPEPMHTDMLRLAVRAAHETQDQVLKAAALASLAPRLPDPARPETCRQVLDLVREIEDCHDWRLITLVSRLARLGYPKETLDFVRTIDEAWIRADALQELAPYLPGALMGEALPIALEIWNGQPQASGLGQALVEGLMTEAMMMAQSAFNAQTMPGENVQPSPVQWFAANLLDTKDTVEDEDTEYRELQRIALRGLAPYLTPELLRQAQNALGPINDANERATAMAGLLWYLPEATRNQAVQQACLAALEMPHNLEHAIALAILATRLDDSARGDILKPGLEAALAVEEPMARTAALLVLMPYLPDGLRKQALQAACAILSQATQEYDRPVVLAWLAPYLDGDSPEVPMAALATHHQGTPTPVQPTSHQPESLVQAEAVRQALAMALKSDESPARALERLGPLLMQTPAPESIPIWHEALHAMAALTRPALLASLRAFAPAIVWLGGPDATAEAFRAIQEAGRWWP